MAAQLHVKVIEEPQEHHRFRYDTEKGSHGSLLGRQSTSKNNKTSPKIQITGYDGEVSVQVSLRLKNNISIQHVHLLEGTNCSNGVYKHTCKVKGTGTIIDFPGIHIKHVGKREAEAKVRQLMVNNPKIEIEKAVKEMCSNLNEVILFFEVRPVNPCLPAYAYCCSSPVKNSKGRSTNKLKIRRIDRFAASAAGNEEMFLLCDKVDKDDIAVQFYDKLGWSQDADFSPTDVHYQVAIVLKIPPYKEQELDKQVNVFFCLYRPSNDERSEEMNFMYKPMEDDGLKRKRAKPSRFSDFDYTSKLNVNSPSFSEISGATSTLQTVMSTPEVVELLDNQNVFLKPSFEENLMSLRELERDPQVVNSGISQFPESETKPLANSLHQYNGGFITQLNNDDFNTLDPEFFSNLGTMSLTPLFQGSDIEIDSPPVQDSEISCSDDSPTKPALISRGTSVDRKQKITTYSGICKDSSNLTTDSARFEKGGSSSSKANKDTDMTGHELAYRLAVQTSIALQDYAKTGDIRILLMTMRHLVAIQDENGDNAIHMSIIHSQKEVLQHLIDVVKNVSLDPINMANKLTQTPLHLAVYTNQCELVRKLLANGASCEVLDRKGNNPFHIVAERGYIETMKILSSHCEANLLNNLNYDGFAPLHLAVQSNRLEFVKELCQVGANVDVHDGTTGFTPLQMAVEKKHLDIIKYFLKETKVDVDAQNFMGNTALHLACIADDEISVELLLKAGADPQIESAEPLLQAESSSDEEEKTKKDEFQGCRPVDLIQSNERIKQLLEDAEFSSSEICSEECVEKADLCSLASKDSGIPIEIDDRLYENQTTGEKSMPDSGIGLSSSGLTVASGLDEATKYELAKLLDLSDRWKTLSNFLQMDFLDCIAEKQSSPTSLLLDYIDDFVKLENALEAMGHYDAASLVKNYLLNRESRNLASFDVGGLTDKMRRTDLNK